jgi:hypothetical protein
MKMKRHPANPLGSVARSAFSEIWQGSPEVQRIRAALTDRLRHCEICDVTI